MIKLILLLLPFLFFSCVDKIKLDTYGSEVEKPIPCFLSTDESCGDYKIPQPSNLMKKSLPENAELNLHQKLPITLKFTSRVDFDSLKDHIILLKDGVQVFDFNIKVHPKDESYILLNPFSGEWDAATYSVILLKGIKDKKGLIFEPSLAYYYATRKDPLINRNNISRVSTLDDQKAVQLEVLRKEYAKFLPKLELKVKMY